MVGLIPLSPYLRVWIQTPGLSLEEVVLRCFVKKVFLKILQNLQEKNCARASFLVTLQDLGPTPPVAAAISLNSLKFFFQIEKFSTQSSNAMLAGCS